ncbi:hypothetical protein ACN06F_07025 [Vreelandella sp. 21]|uniref:hypothetical protein n=1 Tax=Vreelandella sp. 21 TaxID=3402864 RepID=UPI003D9AB353
MHTSKVNKSVNRTPKAWRFWFPTLSLRRRLPQRYALVCAGMRWYALVCAGMRWYALVCAGMRWYALVLLSPLKTQSGS